ncbi:MAG: hypothetical protein EXS14_03940 [Planctomycetes bacterium]|nr:hypothetical protein [Planctomycetota bacterium]
MKCSDVRPRLALLLSDELETDTALEVLRHLQLCTRCSAMCADEERTQARLKSALATEAPPEQLRRALQHALHPRPSLLHRAWPYAGVAASIALFCWLPLLGDTSVNAPEPTLPETLAVGTTFWGADVVQQSERTPLVDLGRLAGMASTERNLEGAALASFYADLTDLERPDHWRRLFTPAAQRSTHVLDAEVPSERTRVFTLSLGAAMELGLEGPAEGIFAGARVEGDAAAHVVVIREGDTCHVLVTSGRLRTLGFMLHAASRSSSH